MKIDREDLPSFNALTRRQAMGAAMILAAAPILRHIPAADASTLAVSEVAPGVFVHQGRFEMQSPENRGDMANATFLIGNDAVAVIDTLGSAKVGKELRAAIRTVTDRPIRYVINTHMHPDHVFGNAAFKEDAPHFVAHHKMARGLAARADRYLAINKDMLGADAFEGIEVILPTHPVEDKLRLDLGGRTLVCEAQETAHTDNDLIVTDSATNTLILADLLFSQHIPTLDGSLKGWLSLLNDLSQRKAARVVPGHGPAAMQLPEALEPERQYLNTLAEDARKLIKEGKTLSEAMQTAGQSEKDKWQLFDDYHARNVSSAFAELEWE
jgi:quinoprotein relay system zinc metallohydrolase 2